MTKLEFITAHSELRKVLFLALSETFLFLFVYEISPEPLNDLRRVHLKYVFGPSLREFECQGQRSRLPGTYFLPIENAL